MESPKLPRIRRKAIKTAPPVKSRKGGPDLFDITGTKIELNDWVMSCFDDGLIVGRVVKINPKTVKISRTDSSVLWAIKKAYYKKPHDVIIINDHPDLGFLARLTRK